MTRTVSPRVTAQSWLVAFWAALTMVTGCPGTVSPAPGSGRLPHGFCRHRDPEAALIRAGRRGPQIGLNASNGWRQARQ